MRTPPQISDNEESLNSISPIVRISVKAVKVVVLRGAWLFVVSSGARLLSLPVVVALCGCAHTTRAVEVAWVGPDNIQLDLDPVPVNGHLAYLVAELRINGHPARFMVDSGASNSWINPDLAKRLGVTLTSGRIDNIGAGAKGPDMGTLDSCDFGFAKVSGGFFVIGDLFEIANKQLPPEKKIDGLVGLDLLTKFRAEIDAGHRTLVFHRSPNESSESPAPNRRGSP